MQICSGILQIYSLTYATSEIHKSLRWTFDNWTILLYVWISGIKRYRPTHSFFLCFFFLSLSLPTLPHTYGQRNFDPCFLLLSLRRLLLCPYSWTHTSSKDFIFSALVAFQLTAWLGCLLWATRTQGHRSTKIKCSHEADYFKMEIERVRRATFVPKHS